MHLDINEETYIDPNLAKIPKQENAIPKMKLFILKSLESTIVETFSMLIISMYTIFTLFWLTHNEFLPSVEIDDIFLAQIDRYFLCIFFIEIVLKSFSSNLMYLFDAFNSFDTVIVSLSVVLNFMDVIFPGLGVLRLIRVVVIILRKITGN
jgi:Ion transport protein